MAVQAWLSWTAHRQVANSMFKRAVLYAALLGTSLCGGFFFEKRCVTTVDMFVYSDESGVFDYKHGRYFVYGGLVFTDKLQRDEAIRRYRAAEKAFRKKPIYKNMPELKASLLKPDDRRDLFKLTSGYDRFVFVVNMNSLDKRRIFCDKQSKNRYMDWMYKVGLKKVFQRLIARGSIIAGDQMTIHCFVDEHSTATNGLYDLRKAIYQEFHEGTSNLRYEMFHNPILKESELDVRVKYVNSECEELIRAADIIANRAYFEICHGSLENIFSDTMCIRMFPYDSLP